MSKGREKSGRRRRWRMSARSGSGKRKLRIKIQMMTMMNKLLGQLASAPTRLRSSKETKSSSKISSSKRLWMASF